MQTRAGRYLRNAPQHTTAKGKGTAPRVVAVYNDEIYQNRRWNLLP